MLGPILMLLGLIGSSISVYISLRYVDRYTDHTLMNLLFAFIVCVVCIAVGATIFIMRG